MRDPRLKPEPRYRDTCAVCSKPIVVFARSWAKLRSYWGIVIAANLCESQACEDVRRETPMVVYREIAQRRHRIAARARALLAKRRREQT